MSGTADDSVSPLIRKAAAWAWRFVVLAAAAAVLFWLVKRFTVVVVPLSLALILTALFLPLVDWLDKHRLPRGLAVLLVFLTGLGFIGGILTFVVTRFIEGLPALTDQVAASIESLQDWATNGPLGLSRDQIDNAVNNVVGTLQDQQDRLTTGVMSTASTLTQIVAGFFIALFALVYFLYRGRNIFEFITKVFPPAVRGRVRGAGKAGFTTLTGYVRATFLVAFVDAVGIGAGLFIMGIPLALPLASLVFLGAFVPFVGAVVTGFLAVIVAVLAKGWVYGLITLGLVLAVQQLEGNVLQPLVMGRAVRLHPLAVLIALTGGAVVGGVVGVLLAVPLLAFLDHAVRHLLETSDMDARNGIDS